MLETILITGLGFLALASLTDIKTREVPDYVSYVFILSGMLVQAYYSAKNFDLEKVIVLLGGAGFATVFGVLMYYKKQWGGADAKLLIGLAFYLSGHAEKWLFAHYFLNFLLVGAVYGLAGSVLLALKNKAKFWALLKKDFKKSSKPYAASAGMLFAGALIFFASPLGVIGLLIGGLALVSLVLNNTNKLMIKKVSVEKISEGDWVVDKVVSGGNVLFNPEKEVDVKDSHIKKFREAGVKSVRIIEGMPFIPAFLVAYLITLVKNDFFVGLVKAFVFPAF